jgi:phytoene synthase
MQLEAVDLATCRAKLAAGSKSFALATLLLPRAIREATMVLYAFCREADDAVDESADANAAVETQLRRLDRVFARRPNDDPTERALAFVIERWRLPRAPFDAMLEGFAWDASGRRYETIDEVQAYAARVAGTVGVLMTTLMGPRRAHVLARACDLGIAMQLTNIARDVGEDATRGRLYLPRLWLREVGVDADAWLARPVASEAIGFVVERVLREADALYARARGGIDVLPWRCRAAVRAASYVYADIGRSIARARYDSVTQRAVVPWSRKTWFVARALVPSFRHDSGAFEASPVVAAQPIIAACSEP